MRQWLRSVSLATVMTLIVQLAPSTFAPTLSTAAAASASSEKRLAERSQWVEDPTLRGANVRHFRAGDYMVAEISSTPLHKQDENGKWKPVNQAVQSNGADGFVAEPGSFKVHFTNKDRGNSLQIDLGRGRKIKLGMDEDLPEPDGSPEKRRGPAKFAASMAGNRMTYKEQRGLIDYTYDVTPDGVKELIILKKPVNKTQFTMPLALEGLELVDNGGGEFGLRDVRTQEITCYVPLSYAYDAAGTFAPPMQQTVVTTGSGAVLVASLDRTWLEDPARRFPVTIDPSVYITGDGSEVQTATIDPYYPGNHSSGLALGYTKLGLLKFNLTSIPQGAVVKSAVLNIQRPFTAQPIQVHAAGEMWYPSVVTWNAPRGNGTTWSSAGRYVEPTYGDIVAGPVAITNLVQAWVNRPDANLGVVLRSSISNGPTSLMQPTLQVIYASDIIRPVAVLSGLEDSQALSGPTTVSVKATDSFGAVGRVELLVDNAVIQSVEDPPTESTVFSIDPRRIGAGGHVLTAQVSDFAGNRTVSTPVPFSVAIPAPPTSVVAVPSGTGATLSWQPPMEAGPFSYHVYRTTSPTAEYTPKERIASELTGTSFQDTSLTGGMAEVYYYAVSAVNATGSESQAASTRVDFPMVPGELQVGPVEGRIQKLAWAPSPRPGVTYNVYRGEHMFDPSPANLVMSGVTATEFSDGLNHQYNGSFELGTVGWDTSYQSYTWDQNVGKFGGSSLKIERTSSSYYYGTVLYGPQFQISGPFTVTAWSRAEGISGGSDGDYSVEVRVNQGGTWLPSATLSFAAGSHDWERQTRVFNNQAGTSTVQLLIVFRAGHTGTAWFDGIQVEPGTQASSYQEYVDPAAPRYYRVTAVDGPFESTPSREAHVDQVDLVPGPLSAQVLGGGRVALSWQPPKEPDVTYKVYRKETRCCYTTITSLVASNLTEPYFVDGVNWVSNAGFESLATNGAPAFWSVSSGTAVESSGFTEARSLRMDRKSNDPARSAVTSIYVGQTLAVPVTVSAYSKALNVTDGSPGDYALKATFFGSDGLIMGTAAGTFAPGTHDWTRVTASYTPPNPIANIQIELAFKGSRAGTVWFDSVQVEEGMSASPWQPGGMPTGGADFFSTYLIHSVSRNGVESQNTGWFLVYRNGTVFSMPDLKARNLGSGNIELAWPVVDGLRYNVQMATNGTFAPVASGLTSGLYRVGSSNLLSNSGFEYDSNNDAVPDGWERVGYGGRQSPGLQGQNMYRLARGRTIDPTSMLARFIVVNQTYATPLTLSASFRSCVAGVVGSDEFYMRLELLDRSGNTVFESKAVKPPVDCASWQTATVTIDPRLPVYIARIQIGMQGQVTGTADIDTVQLESGSSAMAWSESPGLDGNYDFKVLPVDAGGRVGIAGTARVAVTGAPLPATSLTATSAADGGALVTWLPSETPAASYSLYRLPDQVTQPSDANRIALGVAGSSFTDPGNLLSNSSVEFDQESAGHPDGWQWLSAARGGSLDDSVSMYGRKAFRLVRSGTGESPQGISQSVVLNQAVAYPVTFSAYSRAQGVSAAGSSDYALTVRLEGADGQLVADRTISFSTGTHDWERRSIVVTPSAPAARAKVSVVLQGNATGTAWFDGLLLQPGMTASGWAEGPVQPGRTYTYRVGTIDRAGRETLSPVLASAASKSWPLSDTIGDPPGLGIDARWTFVEMLVPGGTAFVNATTGNLVLTATDAVVTGPRLAQVVRRTYNSMAPDPASQPLGAQGWSLNAAQRVDVDSVTGVVTLTEGDGSAISFRRLSTCSYQAPPSVWMKLTCGDQPGTWQIRRNDGIVYEFDAQGRMVRLREPNNNSTVYRYNGSGRLTESHPCDQSDASPANQTCDAAGQLKDPYLAATRRTEFGYVGSSPRISTVTYGDHRTVTYGYDAENRLSSVTDALGQTTEYTYDAQSRLSAVTDAVGRAVLFTYDPHGRLATYSWSGVGGTTRFTYADTGLNLLTVSDPLGRTSTIVTNRTGNRVEVIGPKGDSTKYSYDLHQRLISFTNPRGLVTEIRYEGTQSTPRVSQVIRRAEEELATTYEAYTPFDQPGLVTGPDGTKTKIEYDERGNIVSQTVGFGTSLARTSLMTFTPNGMPKSTTDALGNTTRYEVDSFGQVLSLVDPLGAKAVFTYDNDGNLVDSKDPLGNRTEYAYDAVGRRTSTRFADGGVASWSYDRSGLLATEVMPGGQTLHYQYDAAGRLVAQSDSVGATTRFVLDDAGQVIATLYPNGSRSRTEYDLSGNVWRTYDGVNLTDQGQPIAAAVFTEYGYDSVGNLTSIRLPNGYTMAAEYDLLNRIVKEVRPPATTNYTYDRGGRLLSVKDGNGKWTRYSYDSLGQLFRVYDAANLTALGEIKSGASFTEYGYDKLGRKLTVRDALGNSTQYEYDAVGHLTRETDALGQITMYLYDQAGRLDSTFDRNGDMTWYEYDSMGRVTATHFQDDYRGVTYTYDAAGRRVQMTDSLGTSTYEYDRQGRVVRESATTGTIEYQYDAIGLRTAMSLEGGSIRYQYDEANRPVRITDMAGGFTTFTYGLAGELNQIQFPGGLVQTYTYDKATNRVAESKYTQAYRSATLTFAYAYDAIGNITRVTSADSFNNGVPKSERVYEYDDLYRLSYEYSGGSTNWTYKGYLYDSVGNRIKQEDGTAQPGYTGFLRTATSNTSYEYNQVGWMSRSVFTPPTGSGQPSITTLYSYDGNGNLTQTSAPNLIERYTYNSRGLLTKAQVGNQFSYSFYDGDGRRVRSRVVTLSQDTSTGAFRETLLRSTAYQYDGIFVIAERDASGALLAANSRMPSGRLLTWYRAHTGAGPASGNFLVDHQGSVVKMVDSTDFLPLNTYSYDSFGQVTANEGVPNSFKFTGAFLDPSGLYHLSARFYKPSTGRFITQDTYKGSVWQPWTQNLYTYVGNNPVNYVDPTGHEGEAVDIVVGLAEIFGPKILELDRKCSDEACAAGANAVLSEFTGMFDAVVMLVSSVTEAAKTLPAANKAVTDAVNSVDKNTATRGVWVAAQATALAAARKQAIKTVAKAALAGTGIGTLAVGVAGLITYSAEYNRVYRECIDRELDAFFASVEVPNQDGTSGSKSESPSSDTNRRAE